MLMKPNGRIEWIDYLKAFTCFLVVLGHTIQSFQKAGIDNCIIITTFINWFIYLFHMPLFMCMSGFLYCKTRRISSWQDYKKFELKKIINLLVPYITFYLAFIGINMLFTNSVNNPKGLDDLLGIFNSPIPPYWFLYALLSIFIIVPILEKICKNNYKIVFGILAVLKLISIFRNTNIYFIDSIMKHGIYFYLGYFFSLEPSKIKKRTQLLLIVSYFIMSIVIYKVQTNLNEYIYSLILIFMAIYGICICVNIFKNVKNSKVLNTFKEYTFQIYLLHTIFAAGIRIVLLKLGISNYWIHLIMGLTFSIYIPVLISMISNKIRYTNFFFFPLKTIEEIKNEETNYNNRRVVK